MKFIFANGVTQSLYKRVTKRGAEAIGEVVNLSDVESEEESESESDSDLDFDSDVDEADIKDEITIDNTKVNLDITAMMYQLSLMAEIGLNFLRKF